ncbi:MAG: hypothetical protein QME32_07405 [Endomicrobiia bacterium]|nr:hypothetical protein [Endomicrobiia bacterium]
MDLPKQKLVGRIKTPAIKKQLAGDIVPAVRFTACQNSFTPSGGGFSEACDKNGAYAAHLSTGVYEVYASLPEVGMSRRRIIEIGARAATPPELKIEIPAIIKGRLSDIPEGDAVRKSVLIYQPSGFLANEQEIKDDNEYEVSALPGSYDVRHLIEGPLTEYVWGCLYPVTDVRVVWGTPHLM